MKTHQLWEDLILIISLKHRTHAYQTIFTTGSKIHKNISIMGVVGVGGQVVRRKNQLLKWVVQGLYHFILF